MTINTVAISFNPACRVFLKVNIAADGFPKHTTLCGRDREFIVVTRLRYGWSGGSDPDMGSFDLFINVQTGSGPTKTPIKCIGIC